MEHRHLNSTRWTLAAIDSALEYGDLPDWRELFGEARRDRELAQRMLRVARGRTRDGAAVRAEAMVLHYWPDLAAAKAARTSSVKRP
jgi:hypothetical protein